jgi:hypothetical protein
MGMAKLNIWVSAMDDPCGVDDKHKWYITIYDCDGKVLQWCNKRYVVLPAKCGHLEVEVPPGCYYLKAVWSYYLKGEIYHCNHFTDAAIVQAVCGQTACVKLFNPSIHRCGIIFVKAANVLATAKGMKADLVKQNENAVNTMLKDVPAPQKLFELGHLDEIDKLVKELSNK